MSAYVLYKTLCGEGHSKSINSVAFSPCGRYLAGGADDLCLIIWNIHNGFPLYRFTFESAVRTVIWHPVIKDTVISGCDNGALCRMKDFSARDFSLKDINLGVKGAIHCLHYDTKARFLAIAIGHQVHVARERDGGQSTRLHQPLVII
ncbi:hypothetical protein BV22DRAFT_1024056 [Leucogyrophana mollusca]|uniref:Uncharacterized protein n=1 Tax=Leucogyrophana mollusca TaxID=85980 RepID=A0ACB8B0L6_9AGAM|nr:hypothetical protein BV22DRAFT_1024056 [Leucogyrophana mollusca]